MQSKLNCEVLHDDLAFEVRWAVAGDSIVFQLVAKLDVGEYMSFGVSGDDAKSTMIGGDVVVAWVDKETLKGYADDYFLDAKSQCSGPTGSCPDSRLGETSNNNIRLLNAAMVNGYSIITYQRPLKPIDRYDKQILTNQTQSVIWAIGPLNERNEVSFHTHYLNDDKFINFGRPAKWNCPMPENEQPPMRPAPTKSYIDGITADSSPPRSKNQERRRGDTRRGSQNKQERIPDSEKSATRNRQQTETRKGNVRNPERPSRPIPTPAPVKNRNAWEIPPIQCHEPEDGVFYAQMGPTGGKRGYPAITGHVGWGISWYINGLLIPEINVVRGKTYTFVVEGGFDAEVPAKYHPFYITDDPVGGYEYKTPEEKKNVHIYAGAKKNKDGTVIPTGVGRLCHWTHQGDSDADDFDSFGAYQRTLELKCDQGEPGVIQWTPDYKTPDVVYYQCFTHRYLGWKINVLDSCDTETAASESKAVLVSPETIDSFREDLESSPSIQVSTFVKPNDIPSYETRNTQKPDDEVETNTNVATTINSQPELNPYLLNGQTKESFFIPQHSFFDQPYYLAQTQVFPTHSYNLYPQFQYHDPYQNSFRPSQLIDGMFPLAPEPLKDTSSPITTTSTTVTTTAAAAAAAAAATATTSTTTASTALSVPSTNALPKSIEKSTETPILKHKLPSHLHGFLRPHIPGGIVFRRPSHPTKYLRPNFPSNSPFKTMMRIPPHSSRPNTQSNALKKPYYRPISKTPNVNRPTVLYMPNKHEVKPILLSNIKTQLRPHPPNIIMMKPQPSDIKQTQLISHIYLNNPARIEIEPSKAELDRLPSRVIPHLENDRLSSKLDKNRSPNVDRTQSIKPSPEVDIPQKLEPSRPYPYAEFNAPLVKESLMASNNIKVEVSPQQPSTERNPDAQTFITPFAPVISVRKTTEEHPVLRLKPAVNTGFHPETVVVEGGFKPIISKEIQKRRDEDHGPELEYESEIGVINIKKREEQKGTLHQEENSQQRDILQKEIETFEPVFVPSPLDKQQMDKILKLQKRRRPHYKTKTHVMFVLKTPRSLRKSRGSTLSVEASERVDSYYLPPDNNKSKPTEISKKPSNIDFPPGVVITFDGKRVSGQSLTAKSSNGESVLDSRSSKAAELLKASKPQTEKFKGIIPPLDNIYINPNAPQLQQGSSFNRELGAPSPSSSHHGGGSTKLTLIRQIETSESNSEVNSRRKRNAHHTPEHTEIERKEEEDKNAKASSRSNRSPYAAGISAFVIMYLISLM